MPTAKWSSCSDQSRPSSTGRCLIALHYSSRRLAASKTPTTSTVPLYICCRLRLQPSYFIM